MARSSPFSLVCHPCFFGLLLLSLVFLPFTACGALVSRATPPSDPACGESARSRTTNGGKTWTTLRYTIRGSQQYTMQ
jgi:hypothetical protein